MYRHGKETFLIERSAYIRYEQRNVLTGNTEDCAEVNRSPWRDVERCGDPAEPLSGD